MLDTNVVSALMRDPAGVLARRVSALPAPVSLSIVVAAELRFGAVRKGSPRLAQTVERVLEGMEIEPLAPPVDEIYGHLRHRLEREGRPMDANDLLIAAHALVLDRVLATDDQAFRRVPGLKLENWLR